MLILSNNRKEREKRNVVIMETSHANSLAFYLFSFFVQHMINHTYPAAQQTIVFQTIAHQLFAQTSTTKMNESRHDETGKQCNLSFVQHRTYCNVSRSSGGLEISWISQGSLEIGSHGCSNHETTTEGMASPMVQ